MTRDFEAICIGVSAGGLEALAAIIPRLPEAYPLAVCVVQHVRDAERRRVAVREAAPRQPIRRGTVYIAPPGYHLLVEEDRTFGLSMDPPVHFARPSIDVFFESAAEVFEAALIGVILTGASSDGSAGLGRIKQLGGLAVVQNPATAEASVMPRAAIEATRTEHVLTLEEIGDLLLSVAKR